MTGGAGVGVAKASVLVSVADGATRHGDRCDSAEMAGKATVVNLRVIGINGKACAVTVGDTGGAATRDKLTVIRDMIYQAISMAIFASDHRPTACLGGLGLGNGVSNRTIDWVNSNAGTIGPGGIMTGAATIDAMLTLNGRPSLDLTSMAIGAGTALTDREIKGRVVIQPMGDFSGRSMFMVSKIVDVTLLAFSIRHRKIGGTANAHGISHIMAIGARA